MIIIGYPGIGKSSLAGRYGQYIDLESSNWNNSDGTKSDTWYESYCNIAEDLSRQGFRVFVSCHPAVQTRLLESDEYIIACYPSLELKEEWIKKIADRYERDRSMKNLAALNNVELFYDKQIKALDMSPFKNKLVLTDNEYTLDNAIDSFIIGF